MQTRQTRGSACSAGGLLRLAAAVAGAALALSACSPPRIDGRAEAEQEPSPCESALYAALGHDATADSAAPALLRYHALRAAWGEWLDVAANCPTRFDEGVLRAAKAAARAVVLGGRWGVEPGDWDDTVEAAAMDADTDLAGLSARIDAAGAALAEDRAGFAVEVLAARGAAGASLTLSDRHKAAAELLASLSDEDARLKVYDVAAILASPDAAVDAANGLRASTLAVVEMDCARSLVAAAGDAEADGGADADATDADADADAVAGADDGGTVGGTGDAGATGNGADGDAGTEVGGTDAVAGTGSAADDADGLAEAARIAALRGYAALAASHAYQAFRSGYPMFDEALFAQDAG